MFFSFPDFISRRLFPTKAVVCLEPPECVVWEVATVGFQVGILPLVPSVWGKKNLSTWKRF